MKTKNVWFELFRNDCGYPENSDYYATAMTTERAFRKARDLITEEVFYEISYL